MRALQFLIASLIATASVGGQAMSIDPKPTLTLGEAGSDELFGAGLVGATKLPDGRILVADRGDFSLKVFDGAKLVKSLGRKGSGPGEMTYLAKLWRCGNDIVAFDIENGGRVSVFSTSLEYKRAFRFGGPPGRASPYQSACNAAGKFVHIGWESAKDMKGGAFRAQVPMWFSGVDSTANIVGQMPGSERWGLVIDGALRGTRPLPLGKQPVIAIGADRAYTGSADSYDISMIDFSGKTIGTFGKPGVQLATTPNDVELAIDQESAGRGDEARARVQKSYQTMELPKTIPAYAAMLVDSEGMVWIRDYRRATPDQALWTVFSRDGKQLSEIRLPLHLTVFEIGRDYVLGKYVDPAEDIPEIRLYRLKR